MIQLQFIDNKINSLQEKKRYFPSRIEKLSSTLDKKREELSRSENRLDIFNKDRIKTERYLEEQEDRLEKLKNRTKDIKTNKEHQAHLLEIESAKKRKEEIEDELLLLMEKTDTTKNEVEEAKKSLLEEEKNLNREKKTIEAEGIDIDNEANQLLKERSIMEERLGNDIIRSYNQLRSAGRKVAVVSINNGTCSGCNMNLPPQLVAEVKKKEEILKCSHCHRILFWQA